MILGIEIHGRDQQLWTSAETRTSDKTSAYTFDFKGKLREGAIAQLPGRSKQFPWDCSSSPIVTHQSAPFKMIIEKVQSFYRELALPIIMTGWGTPHHDGWGNPHPRFGGYPIPGLEPIHQTPQPGLDGVPPP